MNYNKQGLVNEKIEYLLKIQRKISANYLHTKKM